MKALSPYQQAILTELGIVQWHLRAPQRLALLATDADTGVETIAARQFTAAEAENIPDTRLVEAGTLTEQEIADSQPDAPPVTEQHEYNQPQQQPVQQVDSQHPMFQDIQLALRSQQHGAALNWQVSDNFSFDGKVLSAPTPQTLSNTPELKKQLWQLLQQHL
ncbi:hypothetical protein AT746_06120 [Lacimicrobium alkaliphilum]|uniref:DNA polymerase III subunit psi n=2 Tax=Lacimicrobium alkaliphilum TaxID=1526571 RepID=A0A0U2PF42_9ALTE|nr:hypothetical protein AT746_06120 [Lacimicrobium alkaliphilum]